MRGGHALKAAFVTDGFPIHKLTVENSPSIASRTWAVGMFKLKARNNVHHEKESEPAKKTYFNSSCPLFPPHKKRRPHQFCSERLRQMTRSIDRPPERKPRTINLLERLSQYVSVHC